MGKLYNYQGNEISAGSGNDVINSSVTGNGGSQKFYFDAKPGDYLRIDFPNGSWSFPTSNPEGYKLYFGYRDNNNTDHLIGNLCKESWPVVSGYDLYISECFEDMKDAYIGIKANSGVEVNFTLTWLSKSKMKDFYSDEMSDTVAKVRARQGGGDEVYTAILCTDIHYRDIDEGYRPFAPYVMPSVALAMKDFASYIRVDNLICLGDGIDGRQTAARGKIDARDIAKFFSIVGVPLLYTIGNHDDNRYYAKDGGDRSFTASEIHAEFIQQNDERTTVGGAMQGCNYYRDIERLQLRCIVLMSINFNKQYYFTTETQNWLTAAFNSMPAGFKAVIFTHPPLLQSHTFSNASVINQGTAVSNIIASNQDKFLVLFDGHTHFDNQWVSPFVEITEGCTKVYNLENGISEQAPEDTAFYTRAVGDYREQLWDVVIVDKANLLLSCIRFGAGVDRYVHLTPTEVAAGGSTTLTPTAITAASWDVRTSESSSISVANGTVTVDAGATSSARLQVTALDSNGNKEIWCIKVI